MPMQDNVKYITRHGKRIAVVEHTPTIQPRKVRKAQPDTFVKLALKGAALAAKAMEAPALLGYVGVSRWVKNRALRNLETAGVIKVKWHPYKSPQITMINP